MGANRGVGGACTANLNRQRGSLELCEPRMVGVAGLAVERASASVALDCMVHNVSAHRRVVENVSVRGAEHAVPIGHAVSPDPRLFVPCTRAVFVDAIAMGPIVAIKLAHVAPVPSPIRALENPAVIGVDRAFVRDALDLDRYRGSIGPLGCAAAMAVFALEQVADPLLQRASTGYWRAATR